jgi:hypothetical protein
MDNFTFYLARKVVIQMSGGRRWGRIGTVKSRRKTKATARDPG